ncbi:tudor domain-containing protein 15 [Notolabrus celidotus]|uniref:tudor domain-containing protein 15 n=1 Tax=Notolabrus celidotus TaxID=1203425 RepID=UPI00148F869A|nr:tudor domain-containing protein 15 [Notolabrus celidotus]
MQSVVGSEHQRSQTCGQSAPCALWPVDLKLTHLDWNPEATLIHFQGQYLTICELDYSILQGEIQNIPKTKAAVNIGEFCLAEDATSARWYRGRVQNLKEGLFDVFLVDHGNVLSVDIAHISPCSSDLFILPPKIVCGFLANVLLLQGFSHSVVEEYLSSLIGQSVTGFIQALLPHKVLLLEASDINKDLVQHGFGRHVDTDTFLLLVEMLTEVPLKQNTEPVPDLLIEKPRGQEFSYKPSSLQGNEQILSFCGPRLPSGTQAKVHLTAAVNPGLFYCRMADKETDLWEMSKKLAEVCEYRTKDHNQKTTENLGLFCSVKGKDGEWYRGFVQYLPVNSRVRVWFIDCGFFESVKVEDIHMLPSDIYSTPTMAFPCSLSCLSDQDEALKTQQLSFLKEGLLGKVLEVDIRSFDEEKHLYCITLISAEDICAKNTKPLQEIPDMKGESVFGAEESSTQSSYLNFEAILGEALGQTLEEEQVEVSSVFVGYVEHVHNPNYFWVRTQKRNHEFEEMMTKLAEHFNQVKMDEDVLLNPEPGTMCCAVFEEDMHYYRGVVTDTLEHGAEVFFIDFGNIEKVPQMLIKKIPETFASKSAFAFCCTLVNVVPLDEVWTSTTSDFFKQAVSDKVLQVHVVQMRKNKCVVDLFEMGSESNGSITELLISSKQAEFWNNIRTEPVLWESTEKTSCPRSDVAADMNGCNTQWEDCEEDISKKETEQPKTLVSFKALSINPGCDFAVRCTNISSPTDFWCQPQDTFQDLERMMDEAQKYYSAHRVPIKSEDSCCVAKSTRDGRFYRAILRGKQNMHSKVILVDYGHSIITKDHNLQAVIPELTHLEGQAFRCSLYNIIEPADPKNSGDWSQEVLSLMKDFTSSGSLRCQVVSQLNVKNKGRYNVVDLYNPKTKQSITKLLLEKGLAREVTISERHLSTVFPESFAYSSFDLTPGKEEQVFITHVSSHCEVYCHLERNTDDIEELEKTISVESEKMLEASTETVVGKLCLAKYLDGKWYRGLINPVESPLHLNVFFVDYGNTSVSEKTHVRFIPRDSVELLYTPMQAVKCSLASLSKGEVYAEVKTLLDNVILNKEVRAVIVGKSDDGSFDVKLFDGDVNINEKVNDLILSLLPKPKTVVSFATRSSTKMKNKTLLKGDRKISVRCKTYQKGQSSRFPTSNAHSSTNVWRASPKKTGNTKNVHGKKQRAQKCPKGDDGDTKTCVPAKPQETSCVKEQKESLDTNPKTKHPQPKREAEIPQVSSLPDIKVCAGFKAKCFTTHVDSVSSFFLQLSTDEPDILKMVEDLNSSVIKNTLKAASSLRINDLVLAEYEEDGALYRAAVKDNEGSSCLKVEFVDYGNSAVIGKEKIYSIPKEFLAQPRFSIPCSLLDANMFESDESFTEAVMEEPLLVDFVSECGSQWKVKVEIIKAAVGLPDTVETDVSSSAEMEKERDAPESAPTIEEKVSSCRDNNFTKAVIQSETTTSQRTLHTATLKPPLTPLPSKVKVIISMLRRRTIRNISDYKKSQRKTKVKSPKAKSDLAITPTTIQAKDTENATILSVLGNSNFYVRLNKTSKELVALQSHITDNLSKCKMVAEEDVKTGLQCLVQVDKEWHRAVVQHVGPRKCEAFLVDHGKTEEIPKDSIRRRCSGLKKIHNLAVLCQVNCLGFSEGVCADKLWCETLKPMVGKEVKLMFVRHSGADDLWMVEIILNGLFLIPPAPSQNNEDITPTPSESRNETEKGELHLDLDLDTSPPQQLTFAPVDLDKAYSGFAAEVTTPFQFCVVLEDLLLVMNKVSIKLDSLPEQMPPLPEAHLASGNCCLIKSESTNKWCRAEIVNLDSTAVLYLVDYGHYECMPCNDLSKLMMLPEDIRNLPKMTYPSILRGVKSVQGNGQWTDEAAVFFQQCLYQKNLQIFFREFVSNSHWKVDILADGVHVAKELVDAGHASYLDNMLGLRFQEQSLCTAAPCGPDSEEECAQDDNGSDGKSNVLVESTYEAEEKMQISFTSGSRQCFLM